MWKRNHLESVSAMVWQQYFENFSDYNYVLSINLDESLSETTGGGESPRFLLATCGGDNLVRLWDVYTGSGKLLSS